MRTIAWIKLTLTTLALVALGAATGCGQVQAENDQQPKQYDIVIYGGSSAGVTAAVQAARMDRSVVIVNPYTHLGGMTSSGLGHTDWGQREVIGGMGREFYQRVRDYYRDPERWVQQDRSGYMGNRHMRPGDDSMWGFEPHVTEEIYEDWLAEYDIPVVEGRLIRDHVVGAEKHAELKGEPIWRKNDPGSGVEVQAQRIVAISTENGQTYRGKVFIDATYEGDLLDEAGVSHIVGREGNAVYGESLNGIQTRETRNHIFTVNGERPRRRPLPAENRVDPYVIAGDANSGLLPTVNPDAGGEDGEGDHRVQSYCYRMCLTNDPDNMVPFTRPAGYDEADYELLFRMFEAGEQRIPWLPAHMPNRKTDTNNRWAVSTNLVGGSNKYPLASYEHRREIEKKHEHWQRGLMWTLANHERVPEHVRNEVSQWGYAADEFVENDNWPHMIYIRVGRRMVSDYVMSEADCRLERVAEDSVGMGSYTMDSHNVQRYVTEHGYVQNEGNIEVRPAGPYSISYRSLVPKADQIQNLIVPVAVSSSHIAFGSIRMEPVFMILGQSAATAASLAIDDGIAMQNVEYDRLRSRLEADGQILYRGNELVSATDFRGIVATAQDAARTGNWEHSNAVHPFIGSGYYHDGDAAKGQKSITFEIAVEESGQYELQVAYAAHENRDSNVPVLIEHAQGESSIEIDQTRSPEIRGLFTAVGQYRIDAGQPARITISNEGTSGYVIANAVRLVPVN